MLHGTGHQVLTHEPMRTRILMLSVAYVARGGALTLAQPGLATELRCTGRRGARLIVKFAARGRAARIMWSPRHGCCLRLWLTPVPKRSVRALLFCHVCC